MQEDWEGLAMGTKAKKRLKSWRVATWQRPLPCRAASAPPKSPLRCWRVATWSSNPFERVYKCCLVLVPAGKEPSRRFKNGAVDESTEAPESDYSKLFDMAVQRN